LKYYPRFGFEPALWHGLSGRQDGVPDEVFMIINMNPVLL